jgi:kumamolisin
VLVSLAPTAAQTCFPGEPCGGPPSTSPRLVAGTVWTSSAGVALEYDTARWDVERADDDVLVLVSADRKGRIELSVERGPSGRAAGSTSLPRWLKSPKEIRLPVPHGPNIGYVDGSGAWYEGLLDSPQGPRQTVNVATLSSARGGSAVAVSAVFFGSPEETFAAGGTRTEVDTILNTVAWPRSPGVAAGASSTGVPPRGLRPVDLADAYGIRPLWDAAVRGSGETIALVSLDTFRQRDLSTYERLMGITGAPPVRRIQVDGPVHLGSGAVEVSLDIEVIRAVAPEATILNYEAPLSWAGFVGALKRINDEGRARVVSVSWGKCLPTVDAAVVEEMENELDRARRAGTTVFVASGDAGAFSCLHSESELDASQHEVAVDWPAASPSVVAVGGTRLALREDGTYYAENGWEDTLSGDGSGGGVSPLHARPAWQRRDVVPRTTDRRQLPDVAGPADCDSAFFIVYPVWVAGKWVQKRGPHGCGTSAAAPFWAGVAALVTQYARQHGVERIGFLGTALYALPRGDPRTSPLRDVRTGGNLLGDAGPGWDYATGLGTPHAWNLARALVAAIGRLSR